MPHADTPATTTPHPKRPWSKPTVRRVVTQIHERHRLSEGRFQQATTTATAALSTWITPGPCAPSGNQPGSPRLARFSRTPLPCRLHAPDSGTAPGQRHERRRRPGSTGHESGSCRAPGSHAGRPCQASRCHRRRDRKTAQAATGIERLGGLDKKRDPLDGYRARADIHRQQLQSVEHDAPRADDADGVPVFRGAGKTPTREAACTPRTGLEPRGALRRPGSPDTDRRPQAAPGQPGAGDAAYPTPLSPESPSETHRDALTAWFRRSAKVPGWFPAPASRTTSTAVLSPRLSSGLVEGQDDGKSVRQGATAGSHPPRVHPPGRQRCPRRMRTGQGGCRLRRPRHGRG